MPAGSIVELLSTLEGYDPRALPVEAAREALRRAIAPIEGEERVSLRDAAGRVLAQRITPAFDVPPHDNSAMDGYAVRSRDLLPGGETVLRDIGTAYAGAPFGREVGAGECARIMTGAPLPPGADTVVMQEAAEAAGEEVRIPAGQVPGQHVRRAGEDMKAGHAVLATGRRLGPAQLGLIASLGIAEISVKRRLKVAHFSTGDELASLGEPLAPGRIYDANRYTVGALLGRLGLEVLDMGVVRDDAAALEHALRAASASADAIITSGGVSGGDADFVRRLGSRLGEVAFWKLAIRPGRPMAFGRIGPSYLFGLPGNPVAAMVAFQQLVREALLRLAGCADIRPPVLFEARCASALRKLPGRTEYQRGILYRGDDGGLAVRSAGEQGSAILRSMSQANCFIVLEHSRGPVSPGEHVPVQMFEED